MRILGFQRIDWMDLDQHRPKLVAETFTTFRFNRRDKPYTIGEEVQIVIKPRSKDRIKLGVAVVESIEPKPLGEFYITGREARADGFARPWDLYSYLSNERRMSKRPYGEVYSKYTLRWQYWLPAMIKYATERRW